MGDKASSTDARGLRAQLEGLNSAEQQKVAYQWALANDKFLDLFVGFQAMSSGNVYPIFVQTFIAKSRFATDDEICEYAVLELYRIQN